MQRGKLFSANQQIKTIRKITFAFLQKHKENELTERGVSSFHCFAISSRNKDTQLTLLSKQPVKIFFVFVFWFVFWGLVWLSLTVKYMCLPIMAVRIPGRRQSGICCYRTKKTGKPIEWLPVFISTFTFNSFFIRTGNGRFVHRWHLHSIPDSS